MHCSVLCGDGLDAVRRQLNLVESRKFSAGLYVVYTLKIDTALAADDAGSAALSDRVGQVIGDVNTAIEARLTAAGA